MNKKYFNNYQFYVIIILKNISECLYYWDWIGFKQTYKIKKNTFMEDELLVTTHFSF